MCEARAHRLHLGEVFSVLGEQGHPAGDEDSGQMAVSSQGHHHGGQALVAGCHSHHAPGGGQGAGEAPQNDGSVIAIGQGIEHAGGALRAAVAGIAAEDREGDCAVGLEDTGGLFHEKGHFPVPGMQAECDGGAVRIADASRGGEHEELGTAQLGGIPSHPGVLRPTENITAWRVLQE